MTRSVEQGEGSGAGLGFPGAAASPAEETRVRTEKQNGSQQGESLSRPTWVDVLVDCGGTQGVYSYRVDPPLVVRAGAILNVPFGSRLVGAIALALRTVLPPTLVPEQVRPIHSVVSQALFPPTYWPLLERTAQYYQAPLMQVLRVALPPGLLGRSQRRVRLCLPEPPHRKHLPPAALALLDPLARSARGDLSWRQLQRISSHARQGLAVLQAGGWVETYLVPPKPIRAKQQQVVTVVQPAGSSELPPRQREILTQLQRQGTDLLLQDAVALCGTTVATLKRLATAGYLVIELRELLRTPAGPALAADQPQVLTAHQQHALAAINHCQGQAELLLHGVTGSGKTEVYLQAIAPRLAAGQSALVLVPEIGLTPQLTDRFRRRFGQQVCVYHSGLSTGERYDTWRRTLAGEPLVVIGTRSAVFAPLPHLGLIVLDEEHDSSFKQDTPTPCYHARQVARWRADLADCPLVLGSATPSLESWTRCAPEVGPGPVDLRMPPRQYLSLPERIQARPLPPVSVIDMRQELVAGNRSIFSRPLHDALAHLDGRAGRQGLLFIHRRGHSRFVSCRSCGHVMMCPHCDVSLAYHEPHGPSSMGLRCHYCGHSEAHPQHCPACGSAYLKHFGSGTQRVVNALAETHPHLRSLRFDSDTTRKKGAHRDLLDRFAQGEADVLVGTQMLTKGIDLPQVTLVGVVAADGLLYMNDYWASERALQTLIQVAGRAGRGQQPGRVLLQTYTPDHPVIEAVQHHGYGDFLQEEWEQRHLLGYPPAGRLILLRLSSLDAAATEAAALRLATWINTHLGEVYPLLGPSPAAVPRVKNRYRWQLLLKFAAKLPPPDLTPLKALCPSGVSLTIDVDPLNLA